ncbi:purine catabolism regulator [Arthrobacter pascens]|uniref:PucR family transcriptional regulator n=1 Tax=Arthrobacter pascens TaxID=1677 RepID=UPI0027833D57|nr:PucR family transcriptional regulator [Arthrobacter pascens]MDQ0634956.1 purine catabolism regulator [Arthrobacter pascens]
MPPGAGTEGLSAVTLRQFLDQLPPELQVLHDGGNGAGTLRWVEPSELEDPTPYLLDGEFLLTAGLPFVGDEGTAADKVDAYVARLVNARVAALGFGLEPYFRSVPDALREACARHNLTLVQVPDTVPFAALGLKFSQLLESDKAKLLRHLADTNRELMRAVLSARPEHELLAALVQRVPVWATLAGADGRVRARAGAGPESAALQPLLARLLAGSGPRVETESLDLPGSRLVVGHPLRSTRDANLGALVLGSDSALTAAQNSVVSSAVGLLELLARQRTSGSLAPSQLATALLLHPDSVGSGGTRHVNTLRDLLAQSTASSRSAPLRVVQGIKADAPAWPAGDSPVRELLQWRRMFDTKLVEITEYGFAAITRLKVDDGLLADVEMLGWRLVIGDATELGGLAAAYQRVTSLRSRVRTTGKSARVDDISWSVTGLLGRDAGTMLAARLLDPVLQQDADRRDAQLGVLRTWLGENGSWDATAKALGLHRNSVRRQINALADVLQMDLNEAQVRAELWFALQFAADVSAAPAPSPGQASQER